MKSVKKFAISLFDYFRFKKSFAQDGEDVVLLSLYEGKKNYKGFFVDIGAHHPVRFSNTWLFYKKGWRGINIDPTPGSMKPFNFLRKRDINLEVGIGKEEGALTFYCFNEPALNTFDSKLAQQRDTGKPYKITKEILVDIMPLSKILDKYLLDNIEIDFFSIDVEGLDIQVLESNNWQKYNPKFILIEDIGFNIEELDNSIVYKFLFQRGYRIKCVLQRTIIYEKVN